MSRNEKHDLGVIQLLRILSQLDDENTVIVKQSLRVSCDFEQRHFLMSDEGAPSFQ